MTRTLITACTLALALASYGNAQGAASSSGSGSHFTKAQLKQMQRNAHTPEQYKTLASYYDEKQKSYLQQAAEEKKEWEQRSRNIKGVDPARNLYEYYMCKASECGSLEAKYNRLMASSGSGSPQ